MNIWQEPFTVRFGNIDGSDRLTLASVFDFFQEVALSHAEDLEVGRETLARTGQVWVLSRMSVVIDRRPRWTDTVVVRSWPRGWEKLFAFRDYAIRDASGRALVRGRGNWLVLDIEKRRPLRVQPFMEKLPLNEGIDALSAGTPGLAPRENLTKLGERRAAYSDIDYYGHVNNARYIQWVQDMMDPDRLAKADQLRLDINYVDEVLPGEIVELWSAPMDGEPEKAAADYPGHAAAGFACEGRKPGGQAVFRAELRLGAETGRGS
jgi:acyl-ACP thioesterase